MTNTEKEELWKAYLAGFLESAEGWNGEYPWKYDRADQMRGELREQFEEDFCK